MGKKISRLTATFAAVGLSVTTAFAELVPLQDYIKRPELVNVDKIKLSPKEQAVTDEFIMASNRGDLAKVKKLLPQVKDINAHHSKDPITALDVAVFAARSEMVKFLLDNKADYMHNNGIIAVVSTLTGSVDTLDVLVKAGANLVDIAKANRIELLPQSIVNNRSKDMAAYLMKNGFDDATSKSNALIASAMVASKEIAAMMIDDHGVAVTQKLVLMTEQASEQAKAKGSDDAHKAYKDMSEFLATKYLEQQKKAAPNGPTKQTWEPGMVPRF